MLEAINAHRHAWAGDARPGHRNSSPARLDRFQCATMMSMPAPAHPIRYTYEEYLALEVSSNVKHEFLAGQIYALAGGTPEHAALAAAVIGLLFLALRGSRCRAYDADLRVRTTSGLATYPDVTIICGPPQRAGDDEQAITNPTLIVEVLRRSTEEYDRGEKFEHYKSLPSLRQYLLVSHSEHRVEIWTRTGAAGWTRAVASDGETVALESIEASFTVGDLYDAAAAPPSDSPPGR